MICLGLSSLKKDRLIVEYCQLNGIRKVVVFSPQRFRFECSFPCTEQVEWAEIILYKFFYRLLQEIDNHTLIVINECLRTQNRYDLTYNCLRQYLQKTSHQLIFQYFPLIDSIEDLMILFDFDTRSRWKREKFGADLMQEIQVMIERRDLSLRPKFVEANADLKGKYEAEKRKLFQHIGLKDPHTIPRNLYLLSGNAKRAVVQTASAYVGRNNRFGLPNMVTYKEATPDKQSFTIFEFPHNFIQFSDFVAVTQQQRFDVLTTDLKVDQWYLQRYSDWSERIRDAYAILQPAECVRSCA